MTLIFLPSNTVARFATPDAVVPIVPEMTPFIEIPVDQTWAAKVRETLEMKPLEYFRANFEGRIPTLQEKQAFIAETELRIRPLRSFSNSLYLVHSAYTPPFTPEFTHLVIRRRDGAPCGSWRHFQQIKNELVGTECEAVELFPAESRLVDAGNDYHLWVYPNSAHRFPLGWTHRAVAGEVAGRRLVGVTEMRDSTAASLSAPGIRVFLGA